MASFLFNPNQLEHPYGVGLFDDLHNYLPELMYDRELFNSPLVTFLQQRVQHVFAEDYSRNRTQYRLFQQSRRRLNSGIFTPVSLLYSYGRAITPPRQTVSEIPVPMTPPLRPVQPLNPPPVPPRAALARPVWTARAHTAILDPTQLGDGLSALLLSALGGGTGMAGLEQMLGGQFLNPVVVAPSSEDIHHATFLTSVEPAADVVCAICQDHTSEENTTGEWRYIRHCNHGFHRSCIDHWFQEHVQCPVCRFDIREHQTE
jgi:hypothetical protein